MDNSTILTWNVTNWITVILMAAIGFMIIAAVQKFVQKNRSGDGNS